MRVRDLCNLALLGFLRADAMTLSYHKNFNMVIYIMYE